MPRVFAGFQLCTWLRPTSYWKICETSDQVLVKSEIAILLLCYYYFITITTISLCFIVCLKNKDPIRRHLIVISILRVQRYKMVILCINISDIIPLNHEARQK